MLSDPEKRKIYDQYGEEGLDPNAGPQRGHFHRGDAFRTFEQYSLFVFSNIFRFFGGGFGGGGSTFEFSFGGFPGEGPRRGGQRRPPEPEPEGPPEEPFSGTLETIRIGEKNFKDAIERNVETIWLVFFYDKGEESKWC